VVGTPAWGTIQRVVQHPAWRAYLDRLPGRCPGGGGRVDVGWLLNLLAGWLAGWLFCWLAGWQAGWLVGYFVGWLAGRLVDWLVGWLAGRLVGWLVGWLVK
jgi:hypothetical protein